MALVKAEGVKRCTFLRSENCNNGSPIEAVRRAASAAFQDQRECNGQRNMPARLLAQNCMA
jgi:hypothetical protein